MASSPTTAAVTPDVDGGDGSAPGTQGGRLTHAPQACAEDAPRDASLPTTDGAAPGDDGEWRTQSRGAKPAGGEAAAPGSPPGAVLSEETSYLVEVVKYMVRRKCEGVTVQLLGAQLSPPRSCKGQLVGLVSSRPDVFTVYYNDDVHPWVKLATDPQAALQALQGGGGGSNSSSHPPPQGARAPASPGTRGSVVWTPHPGAQHDEALQYLVASAVDGLASPGGGFQTRFAAGWGGGPPVVHREWEPTPEAVAAYSQARVYVAGGSTLDRWALRSHFASKCGPVESVYHAPTEARACFITFTTTAAARAALALGVHSVSGTNGRVVQCRPYVPFRRSGENQNLGASRVPHQVPVQAPPPTSAAAHDAAAQPTCGDVGQQPGATYAAKLKDPACVVAPDTPGQGHTEQPATVASSTAGSRSLSAGDSTSEVGSHGRSESLHSAPGGFDAADGDDGSGSGGLMMAPGATEGGHHGHPHAHPHLHHHLSADAAPMMVPMMVQGHSLHPMSGQPVVMVMNAMPQAQVQPQQQPGSGIDIHMLSGLMAVLSPGVSAAVKIELQAKGLWPSEAQQWSAQQQVQQRAVYYTQ